MKDSTKLVFLLCVFAVLSVIDARTKYKKCIKEHPRIIPELLLHRLIGTFIYLGWIFNNKIVLIFYLLFELGILLHWCTNHFKCCLTENENKICKFDKKERYDYVFRMFSDKTAVRIAIIAKAIIVLYVIYKIFYK